MMRTFEAAGGRFVDRTVHSLRDVEADLVVNCTGLGARELCSDRSVSPIRGQIVHVLNPGIESVLLDEQETDGIAYVVPRGDDVVLGGTAQEGDEELAARAQESREIIERCARLHPALHGVTVTAEVVGLRPGRPTVRLEVELVAGHRPIVHNYGHGGAGVTLSWGCASDVVEHVHRILRSDATSHP
jgi:D-amino-acid oxidase